jgi:hypothetical protein
MPKGAFAASEDVYTTEARVLLGVSTPQGPELHLDVSTLLYRGMCCIGRCLLHRGLSCIWMCLHYKGAVPRGVYTTGACAAPGGVYATEACAAPEGVFTTGYELHLRVST